MDELIIVGAGGHAKACIDVIEKQSKYKIIGLIEQPDLKIKTCLGYPVIGTNASLGNLRKECNNAVIGIGQIKTASKRIEIYNMLKSHSYNLPVIISPFAHISKHSTLGEGTIVMHGCIINSLATIGRNCIINNNALIEHDAVIGDHCHIATGAIINGEVSVGRESFMGSGTVTKQSISISNNCIIGAGVVVKHDVKSNQVVKN